MSLDITESRRSRILRFTAFLFLLSALALIIFLRMFQTPRFNEWYAKYADLLLQYKEWIENIGKSYWTVIILLLNFILKAFVPWFPLTIIMFLSGMMFEWYIAIPINLIGSSILFTIKFFWGKKYGGGNAEKILNRFDKAHIFVEKGKVGSKMVLFFSRMTPLVPINSVSQLYGTTTMSFWHYIIISDLGFAYKLFSYTMIGRNIFNPISASFIFPLIALLIISGLVLLLINAVISATSPLLKKIFQRKENESL